MSKKRTIQQISETEAKGKLISLLSEWIVNPLENDFGIDFEVRIADNIDSKMQEVSEISFYIQNKSSINSQNEQAVEDLDMDDWELYLGQRIPVLLVKYDVNEKLFYWGVTQDYAWDVLDKMDSNWKRQKFKRILLTKKLTDLNILKKAITESQKKITRHHSLNLGIGEGISITQEDLLELKKHKEKNLLEYKALTLQESYYELKKGNRDRSTQLLKDVYNTPKEDESKIRAIIGIIFDLNIVILEENKQIVFLAEEGIKIAKKINILYLEKYLVLLRNQAKLYFIIKKMSEIKLGLQVQSLQKEQSFSFFYNQELVKLSEFHQSLIREINEALKWFLDNGHVYYYIASLPLILDTITVQVMQFAPFDKKIITKEEEGRASLISQCEFLFDNLKELDLLKPLYRSAANYCYFICKNDKAIDYMNKALEIAKKDNDKNFIDGNALLLKKMRTKSNPYDAPETKPIGEMNLLEYQEITKKLIEFQGVNLSNNDDLTNAIKMALRDMNPTEYFKHCENLRICYVNTSQVGVSIGLPSMGTKFIWCKYCKNSYGGFNLDDIFNTFKKQNCKECKCHRPRKEDWVCNVKWIEKQEQNLDFRKVLDNFKKNW